jgi:hypothetical protein
LSIDLLPGSVWEIISAGNTNYWPALPFYTLDLVTPTWVPVPNVTGQDQGSGQQRFTFPTPTTNRVHFFRIRAQ